MSINPPTPPNTHTAAAAIEEVSQSGEKSSVVSVKEDAGLKAIPSWRAEFTQAFRRANEPCQQMRGVIESHMRLSKQNRKLTIQLDRVEKQLLSLQHEKIEDAGGGKVSLVTDQLEAKIVTLTAELAERGALEMETNDTKAKLLEAEKALAFNREALQEAQKTRDDALRENAELKGNERVLQAELATSRTAVTSAEELAMKLRSENDAILQRMLADKMTLQKEMNTMNDLVESLSSQIAFYKHEAELARAEKQSAEDGGHDTSAEGGGSLMMGMGDSGGPSARWNLDSVAHVPSQCRFNLKAHHTEINSVCYSDTDPLVYTGSSDGTVKVWDTQTGHCQSTLRTIGGGGGGGVDWYRGSR